ncbi:hypothetical protein O1Q96_26335 [Streptomyces sp. Qhu-G9]|uniref:hypothetical protein n=1 Tax=Streptomyces sp. Qhu-G9 TaxID=3452799 RepID=UPI0022AC2B6D|nr:hypothetical protein [Streptomyces aurantiacus]WAU82897.1 hypothetical protein O1Q96_26335 [Streptomyces aurantiacus]
MRRPATAAVVIALASLGLIAPATSATAAPQDYRCQEKWPGRDGYVRAWQHYGCDEGFMGETTGDDRSWSDGEGAFRGLDHTIASSVMNSGFIGGKDVVAFYAEKDYAYEKGYVCLAPGEKWADNLTDNYFYGTGTVVNDRIRSHRWVNASGCAAGSWLT